MVLNKISKSFKKDLLKILQKEFPLNERPFLKISQKLNVKEDTIIEIVKELQEKRIIRQISGIFNPYFFGHKSSLIAFNVPEKRIEEVAKLINKHPGVSHNYLRNHYYNMWFILVTLPQIDPLENVNELVHICKINDYLYLPAVKIYKISTVFDDQQEDFEENEIWKENFENSECKISEKDKKLVKILQEPLPLTKTPFKHISKFLNIEEKEIFMWIKKMKKRGALRRFGALLKHDKLGYKFNVMVAWEVKKERIEKVINVLSKNIFITHCYERKTYPHWKYNLYTMCHFKKEEEKNKIPFLAKQLKIENYLLLETIKELKKIRLKLFYELNS